VRVKPLPQVGAHPDVDELAGDPPDCVHANRLARSLLPLDPPLSNAT
jgi:hypothetical protein